LKSLLVKDITASISGELVKGEGTMTVNNFARTQRAIGNYSLYFDASLPKSRYLKRFKMCKGILVVTSRPSAFQDFAGCSAIIKVPNIKTAYWQFISYYRDLLDIPVIGITGTCGKTTTKEMIKHILTPNHNIIATYRNANLVQYNSLTLLKADDKTEFSVFEMGLEKPGDLSASCLYLKPQIRILLNIGTYHLKGCGTPEAYIKAKTEILHGLNPNNGVLILNADDETIKKTDVCKYKNIVYYGFDDNAYFKAKNFQQFEKGIAFTLIHNNQDFKVSVPGHGRHTVYNALAAIAAVSRLGIAIDEACKKLATYKHFERHQHVRSGVQGCIIINDSWSNSPLALKAALETLKDISGLNKRAVVLGQMHNLGVGKFADEQYEKCAEKIVETGVDMLVLAGPNVQRIGTRALELGMDSSKVHFSNCASEIYKLLRPFLNKDSYILVKINSHLSETYNLLTELEEKIYSKEN
jgi:UDP-N-acetylmuramoyl-tripeptide--D-alanyl-D-alanine ligase